MKLAPGAYHSERLSAQSSEFIMWGCKLSVLRSEISFYSDGQLKNPFMDLWNNILLLLMYIAVWYNTKYVVFVFAFLFYDSGLN